MSDIFDDASDLEAMHREMAIKAVRARAKSSFTGHCRYCNETVKQGVFCSAECREDQELLDKVGFIRGAR